MLANNGPDLRILFGWTEIIDLERLDIDILLPYILIIWIQCFGFIYLIWQ